MLSQGPLRSQQSLVLASSSPRRQMLLSTLGIIFSVIPSTSKEPLPKRDEAPLGYARRAALFKAQDVAQKNPSKVILAADTIVVFDNQILGKPKDHEQAFAMLKQLNGHTHEVITGCCLLPPEKKPYLFHTLSRVTFANWPKHILTAYASTEEPMDKAGAYALQGAGSFLVRAVERSHSNIIGLPLTETVEALLQMDVISTASPEV
ncbi:MAG: septum formation protein Maf [Acidobacteria bacterium]|nr:MAG: septum formation protein Maf [Acidobacteriota bacterium]